MSLKKKKKHPGVWYTLVIPTLETKTQVAWTTLPQKITKKNNYVCILRDTIWLDI